MSYLGDVLRKLVYSNVSQTGGVGAEPPAAGGYGGLGAKPPSRWAIFVKFGKNVCFGKKLFWKMKKLFWKVFEKKYLFWKNVC